MEIGAQLFTIRDFCQNLNDFDESLKKIADIGYKNVQVSGTCEFDPKWLDQKLKENGLKCVITHNSGDKLILDAKKVCEDNDVFGCEYVGVGGYSFRDGTFEDFYNKYKNVPQAVKDNGKYFMYHNHDSEYKRENGKLIFERIIEKFSPEILGVTLDVFWVQVGGGDPAYWLEKLSGRVPCIHLKDYAFDRTMAVLGEGNINFDRVFKEAEAAGTKYMFVEQDDCYGENPFDCLKRSYDYLVSRGF